ncbi:hypothetical protein NDA11_005367 [Ustilago hordei]|uniref:Uncharacterized protein n=1 Tax=Ustilago hordei TaxID=120017 RepID=I2FMG6_USTHO|nr:uncharacterized protein UHO2_01470 [Ustilago hordei]KAJ1044782.1 hypothetical protein NDA10_007241 [Ustilago hordei]KAJ1583810.1 hypothetical protein NDA15_006988 [Ustilago hordei]KAJ1586763.1 hypothetical protein NDA11_005367 [Ustilago hordei]KAJ1591935.1 hypothetical protein NDA12_004157 [Ustilago hordei]KAJ1602686.1 hypothetical protein NDA14_000097 [Ustilago hordei]
MPPRGNSASPPEIVVSILHTSCLHPHTNTLAQGHLTPLTLQMMDPEKRFTGPAKLGEEQPSGYISQHKALA